MQVTRSIQSSVLLSVLVLLAGACGEATITPAAAGQTVAIEVSPGTASLAPAGQQQFVATVTGTADTAVVWAVQEVAPAGSVSATGLYTAPATPGTFHVVATSAADPTRSARATVTVTAPPVVAVVIAPKTATVLAGGQVAFSATVTGSANTSVTWSVQEAAGCGTVDAAGRYSAPPAAATCHVVAASVADPGKVDTATVTVTAATPIVVAISPTTPTVGECQSVTFTATVSGTTNQGVLWSVLEGSAGGAVTTAGVYTAPASAGAFHVVAASVADPTRSATMAVTVVSKVLSVAVSPATVTVPPGGTAQFTATVTTSCGVFTVAQTIDSSGALVGAN